MFHRINVYICLVIIMSEVIWIVGIHIKIKDDIDGNKAYNQKITKISGMISKDLKCFPVAFNFRDDINYEDTYNAYREQGGHEGCDILYNENAAGIVPIVSATDGVVTNLGWLHLGGYRIGITSDNGIYYYYAHLDSYSPGLHVGKQMRAGEFLGFMGDTGEGPEGTKGKFPVHLHFGIYINDNAGSEEAINPYPYLLKINEE